MAPTETCANHPAKRATHTCQQCGKPLCPQCVSHTDMGTLCGSECYEARKAFRDKLSINTTPQKRIGIDFGKALKGLAALAILLGVLYGVFFFVYGVSTPDEILNLVKGWFRTATGP